MTPIVRQKLSATFDQVSAPLYYKGEGPYFLATLEHEDDVRFYFYEVNDVESFLDDPENCLPSSLNRTFLFSATDDMDLKKIEHTGRYFHLFLMRLVPDSPVCRLAIKQIHEHHRGGRFVLPEMSFGYIGQYFAVS